MRKGISLVALVITIIVLIILTATVVVQFGNNDNILNRANKAADKNNEKAALDKVLIELSDLKFKAAEENMNVYEYIFNSEHANEVQEKIRSKDIGLLSLDNNIILFVVNEYKIYADEKGNIIEEPNITFGEYEIVFDVNGGNAQEIEGLVHEVINSNTVLTNAVPTRTGYTFMGWYDGTDYTKSNMYFDAQQKICNIDKEKVKDNSIVLYAGWKPIEYTINYYTTDINANYSTVEYIESKDGSYIDTGVTNINENFGVEITFSMDANTTWVLGSVMTGGNINDLGISKNSIRFGTNYNSNVQFEYGKKYTVYVDKNGYSINGEKTLWKNTSSLSISSKSIYLFWANGSSAGKGGRIYNVKLYNNGNLTHEFIPCINKLNDVLGLYETCYKKFYGGNFSCGNVTAVNEPEFSQVVKYDTSSTIYNITKLPERYILKNWNTSINGAGKIYNANQEIINLSSKDGDIINLYAQIEKINDLPSSYQKVEYIESKGNQYIDTGIKMTKAHAIEATFQFGESNAWILGKVETAGRPDDVGISKTAIRFGTNYDNTLQFKDGEIYKVYVDQSGYSINDQNVNWNNNSSLDTGNKTIYLFWANGSIASKGGRIYNVKFYLNGKIRYDLIPCYRKSDNKPGLFDIINDTFYINAGTDDFSIGTRIE